MTRSTLLGLAAALMPVLAAALTPEEQGLAIVQEAERRNQGYGDAAVTLVMILRNRQGEESSREIRSRVMEVPGDGDKSLVIFDRPKDVSGTALLTVGHKTVDDERWLYLPGLKRVKRIASNNQSAPFMGSEFAYEDIGTRTLEKYSYKFLREEKFDGLDCWVSEIYPKDRNSAYTRQIGWLDKAEYRPLKVEFYDRKATLLKTLQLKDYQKHLDKYWRPGRLEMVNHQTGKSTTLLFKDYRFGNGYTERDFDQTSLQAAR